MSRIPKTITSILSRFRSIIVLLLFSCSPTVEKKPDLEKQTWIHGSANCETNADVPIQIVKYDDNTWILRQNKCINYEAPFMFLFIGNNKALLMDTGATSEETSFPLYQTVKQIIDQWQIEHDKKVTLLVAHTHGHGDHYAADKQFDHKPNVSVVRIEKVHVIDFFKFTDWPNDIVEYDLGDRKLKIIAIPGHQEASIAVYDPSSQFLLTGDTFYPGRLYVRDWSSFKQTINRLVEFSKANEIKYMLGNHIEMTQTPGVDYPTGTTYQPDEQRLPLTIKDLNLLQTTLSKMADTARQTLPKFIIYPK